MTTFSLRHQVANWRSSIWTSHAFERHSAPHQRTLESFHVLMVANLGWSQTIEFGPSLLASRTRTLAKHWSYAWLYGAARNVAVCDLPLWPCVWSLLVENACNGVICGLYDPLKQNEHFQLGVTGGAVVLREVRSPCGLLIEKIEVYTCVHSLDGVRYLMFCLCVRLCETCNRCFRPGSLCVCVSVCALLRMTWCVSHRNRVHIVAWCVWVLFTW